MDADGEQVGVVTLSEARKLAYEKGLDLVEIAPNAYPPVCKVMNYGKYKYVREKQEKKQKKVQQKIKEIKIRPGIAEHDLQTKAAQAKEFLNQGDKVKVTCSYRGREMAHPEIGHQAVNRIVDQLIAAGIAVIEAPLRAVARTASLVLAPTKAAKGGESAKVETEK